MGAGSEQAGLAGPEESFRWMSTGLSTGPSPNRGDCSGRPQRRWLIDLTVPTVADPDAEYDRGSGLGAGYFMIVLGIRRNHYASALTGWTPVLHLCLRPFDTLKVSLASAAWGTPCTNARSQALNAKARTAKLIQ